jgi:hypothetical protein
LGVAANQARDVDVPLGLDFDSLDEFLVVIGVVLADQVHEKSA